MEFTFWCLRYIFTFIMFILGIKAPGISTVRDYYSRYTDAEVSLSYSFFCIRIDILRSLKLSYPLRVKIRCQMIHRFEV